MVTVDRTASPVRPKRRGSQARQRRRRRRPKAERLGRSLFQKRVLEALERLESRSHRDSGPYIDFGSHKGPEIGSKGQDGIQPVALYAELDRQGVIQVSLPENVRQDRALMLWLHHRVVDLLAERGLLDFLFHDVEERLALLSPDVTSDYVADLLDEGQSAVEPPEDETEEAVV